MNWMRWIPAPKVPHPKPDIRHKVAAHNFGDSRFTADLRSSMLSFYRDREGFFAKLLTMGKVSR